MQLSPIAFSGLKTSGLPQLIKPTFGVIDTYKFDTFGEVPEVVRTYHEAVIDPLTDLLGCKKSELRFDHVFLAANSGDTLRNWFEQHFAKAVNWVPNFKNREFGLGLWPLKQYLMIANGFPLKKIEAADPKPGEPEPNGLKHMAYILKNKNEREASFQDLLQKIGQAPNKTLTMSDNTTVRFNRVEDWNGDKNVSMKLQFINDKTGPDGFEIELRRIPTKKDKKPATA